MFWFLKNLRFFIYIHIGEMKINFEVDTKEYWSMYGYTIYAIAPLPMYTSFFLKSFISFRFISVICQIIRPFKSFIPCDLHLFICRDSSNTYSISSQLKSQERKISYSKTSYILVLSPGVKNTVWIRIRLVGTLFSISTTYLPVKK